MPTSNANAKNTRSWRRTVGRSNIIPRPKANAVNAGRKRASVIVDDAYAIHGSSTTRAARSRLQPWDRTRRARAYAGTAVSAITTAFIVFTAANAAAPSLANR